MKKQWAAHSHHVSEKHNSHAIISRYLGYWDANPATLTPLSPSDLAPLYVEMIGGAALILATAKGLIKAMSTQLWLDFRGFRLGSEQTANKALSINLNTPDNGEQLAVELNNDALTSVEGYSLNSPALMVTIEKEQLERLLTGSVDFDQLVQEGFMKLDGSLAVIDILRSMPLQFTLDLEILHGAIPTSRNQGVDANPA